MRLISSVPRRYRFNLERPFRDQVCWAVFVLVYKRPECVGCRDVDPLWPRRKDDGLWCSSFRDFLYISNRDLVKHHDVCRTAYAIASYEVSHSLIAAGMKCCTYKFRKWWRRLLIVLFLCVHTYYECAGPDVIHFCVCSTVVPLLETSKWRCNLLIVLFKLWLVYLREFVAHNIWSAVTGQ